MEYSYSSYTKLIDNKIYYFVEEMMTFPEIKGAVEVQVGYGMHTDFEEACNICGIDDSAIRKQLLFELKQHKLPKIPNWLPIVVSDEPRNIREKHSAQIINIANRWLNEHSAAALN